MTTHHNKPEEKCCKKCDGFLKYIEQIGVEAPTEGEVHSCRNEFCPCHKPENDCKHHNKPESWEEEFERIAGTFYGGIEGEFVTKTTLTLEGIEISKQVIKSFITSLLKDQAILHSKELEDYKEGLRGRIENLPLAQVTIFSGLKHEILSLLDNK